VLIIVDIIYNYYSTVKNDQLSKPLQKMSNRNQIFYSIYSTLEQPNGSQASERIFHTSNREAFDVALVEIRRICAPLPKVSAFAGGAARQIRVYSVLNQDIVDRCRIQGKVSDDVQVGVIFPSVQAAAVAFGYKPGTLKQLFHQARKHSSSGLDQEIMVHGYEVGYVDKTRSMNRPTRVVPEPPAQLVPNRDTPHPADPAIPEAC
jgi:hypothetical protein